MRTFLTLTKRNVKYFFKDKGMFFVSLITPVILLVLYATFLANVYRESFEQSIPALISVPDKLVDAVVVGQLLSSLLAVVPVTVAFNSNMRMVQDRMYGVNKDFFITPTKRATLAFSYFFGSLITTMIMCFIALGAGLGYAAIVGWYLSFTDILLLILDVFLLAVFGTAFSSCINVFLSTQGQMSAVGTIVSAGYGFVCGAYMPISQFGEGLQKALSCLPGTYGTSLVRNHSLNGTFEEMLEIGFPEDVVQRLRDSIDCNIYFFGTKVEIGLMYVILAASSLLLIGLYVLASFLRRNKI